jgi:hypothetical protein
MEQLRVSQGARRSKVPNSRRCLGCGWGCGGAAVGCGLRFGLRVRTAGAVGAAGCGCGCGCGVRLGLRVRVRVRVRAAVLGLGLGSAEGRARWSSRTTLGNAAPCGASEQPRLPGEEAIGRSTGARGEVTPIADRRRRRSLNRRTGPLGFPAEVTNRRFTWTAMSSRRSPASHYRTRHTALGPCCRGLFHSRSGAALDVGSDASSRRVARERPCFSS